MPGCNEDGELASKPVLKFSALVPIGDPIEVDGVIHRVACHLDNDFGDTMRRLAITACNLETDRFRRHYPTGGRTCRKCWPKGICCPLHGPRHFLDNTPYFDLNPF